METVANKSNPISFELRVCNFKRAPTMTKKLRIAVLLLLVNCCLAQSAPQKSDVENRVNSILEKMTVEEKIEVLGGFNDFDTRPIPRLGIPALKMSDGSMGVHDYGLTTAYPAGIALAAS